MTILYIPNRGKDPTGFGTQDIYRFDNDYGASVVRHRFSYGGDQGLFELAVIEFESSKSNKHYRLVYNTPIADDVIGYLTKKEVNQILGKIKLLENTE